MGFDLPDADNDDNKEQECPRRTQNLPFATMPVCSAQGQTQITELMPLVDDEDRIVKQSSPIDDDGRV